MDFCGTRPVKYRLPPYTTWSHRTIHTQSSLRIFRVLCCSLQCQDISSTNWEYT